MIKQIIEQDDEVEIVFSDDFDPIRIFECGQCFRWNADENGVYYGVVNDRAVYVRSVTDVHPVTNECPGTGTENEKRIIISGTLSEFECFWREYFDLDRDYSQIRKNLSIDRFMRKATDFGAGLRILKQDKWEALCSFIISQNNHIPRIKNIINSLCTLCGDRIVFNDTLYYSFPKAETIAQMEAADMASIRCGYRAEYIIKAARDIKQGKIDLESLVYTSPAIARHEIKKLHGVGNKVADCFILFGLHHLDAFPVDIWIDRAVKTHYGPDFDPGIFAPYAGIAQQYIFYYMRSNNKII